MSVNIWQAGIYFAALRLGFKQDKALIVLIHLLTLTCTYFSPFLI